jgi:aldehyde:ferredoxin oxidoreductase
MGTKSKFGGYKNRILRVNLTDRTFKEETLSEGLIHDYIGGRGFGARLLYDDLKPGINPLGGENELISLTGPITGTNAQCFPRWKVTFKSPLTGTYFTSSAGGYFAPEQKAAGFDVIIIEGVADQPVYLWVHDGKYELRDATYLWGLDCDDTQTLIREELGDHRVRIACIGPAGEHLVKYAAIITDRRAAGRGGGGTVMGAKKLKAIAVRGNEKVGLADPGVFQTAVREHIQLIKNNENLKKHSVIGTQEPEFTNLLGMFPTRNFQEGVLPHWEKIEASEYDKLRVRKTACYRCMVHCGSIAKVNEGEYQGAWTEGPEYETAWAFTGPAVTPDIGLTIAADKLCDDLGLDSISTGNTIGFAYELYERGIISKEDTGGFELTFGNKEPILELVRKIAYRQDFGNLLAEGTREAARRIGKGAEQYAMQVKGLEIPAYHPRGAKAHGLNLLTISLGADHNAGYGNQEIFNITVPRAVDRFAVEGKGELTKYNQDITAMMNTGILCNFLVVMIGMTPELYGKLLSAATGVKDFAAPDYLWKVGERIINLERMFNIREGLGRKDDVFPKRITEEPMPAGPSEGQVFEENLLLPDYYKARGWDLETGIPSKAKLSELGLDFTIK